MLFWSLIALLTLAATAAVVVPLLRRPSRQALATSDQDRRLAVYRDRRSELEADRRSELEADRAAGRLAEPDAARAVEELAQEAAVMLGPADPATASAASRPTRWWLALLVAVLVPTLSLLVYRQIGAPMLAAVDGTHRTPEQARQEIDRAITELVERTKKQPDDGEAWAVLAQAQRLRNNYPQALAAYERATKLLPDSARLLADHAETIAASRNGDFSGQAEALLDRAMAIDPNDGKVIALMGAAQYRLGRPERALPLLKRLLDGLPADAPQSQQIRDFVVALEAQLAARGDQAAAPKGQAAASETQAPSSGPAAGKAAITGKVQLAAALQRQLDPSMILFITARAPTGPRLPFAASRITTPSLPREFQLGDEQAMNPQRLLSSATEVVIEARLSRSGNPIPQPGDLFGVSTPVQPGRQGVQVTIDQVVGQ